MVILFAAIAAFWNSAWIPSAYATSLEIVVTPAPQSLADEATPPPSGSPAPVVTANRVAAPSAAPAIRVPATSDFGPGRFRLAPVAVLQTGGNASFSAFVSWNPEWDLHRRGGYVALNLGAAALQNAEGGNFAVLEYQLVLGGRFSDRAGFELAGGAQTWTGLGGTSPLVSGTVYWKFPHSEIFGIDRVLASYGGYLQPDFYADEIKLGVGLTF